MASLFGAGSTLGPFGNAGPSSAGGSNPFSFNTGEVAWRTPTTAQAAIPWVGTAVIAAAFVGAIWLVTRN